MSKRNQGEPLREHNSDYDGSDSYKERKKRSLRQQRRDSQDRKRYKNLDALLQPSK